MPTIIWSKPNIASNNICKYLIKEYGFEGSEEIGSRLTSGNIEMLPVDKNVLDFEYSGKTDYVIVPSTHRSEKNIRCFTTHTPGNWKEADLGGESETLNWAYASFMKIVILKIKDNYSKHFHFPGGGNGDHVISYEVDHHGPTLPGKIPIAFVEIGSTEKEWNDHNAVKLIGDSIMQAIDDVQDEQPYFGIGGGHYAPRFTSLTLKHGYAIGHMLPKYREYSFTEKMFKQAIEKNKEGSAKAIIDWKGITSGFREKAIKILDDLGVEWEKRR